VPARKIESTEIAAAGGLSRALKAYFGKMRCAGSCNLPRTSLDEIFFSSLGTFLGIGPIALLSLHYGVPLLIPSFGASAALLYAACHAPLAQPRNVLGGHVFSALAGVAVYRFFGNDWWAVTLAVMLAIVIMMATGTMHPPGGATAFVAVFNGQGLGFVLAPVALGSVLLILVAILVNNLHSARKYPHYWL